jgi:indolepyruvate decarboxylase
MTREASSLLPGVIEWVGNCNELNAAYAADGYARLNGIGALTVTNAVGALSAINGVAGSYSEHVPVICICGSIPFKAMDRGLGMHHTMADGGNWDRYLSAFSPVTAAQARVSPYNAVIEIDRLILTAWRQKLPVYLELPSDIVYLEIEVPDAPLVLEQPPSDPERLRSCVSAIAGRLTEATSPAVLVDLDVDRFGVAAEVTELAAKMQLPVAVSPTAKGVVDETFPCYAGLSSGQASAPRTREAIENSDCLLAIGYRPIDVTTGEFSISLPADTIHLRGHAVDVGDDNFQAVTLKEVLRGVIDAVSQVTDSAAPRPAAVPASRPEIDGAAKLTQSAYWPAIQDYIRPGDVLLFDKARTDRAPTWS